MHSLSITTLACFFAGFAASFPISEINPIAELDQSSIPEKGSSRISRLWAKETNQDSDIGALLKHIPKLSRHGEFETYQDLATKVANNGAHLNEVEKSIHSQPQWADRPLSRKMKRESGSSNDAEPDETPASPSNEQQPSSEQEENAVLGEIETSPKSVLRLTPELLENQIRDELLKEVREKAYEMAWTDDSFSDIETRLLQEYGQVVTPQDVRHYVEKARYMVDLETEALLEGTDDTRPRLRKLIIYSSPETKAILGRLVQEALKEAVENKLDPVGLEQLMRTRYPTLRQGMQESITNAAILLLKSNSDYIPELYEGVEVITN